jgi:hypothetical protein
MFFFVDTKPALREAIFQNDPQQKTALTKASFGISSQGQRNSWADILCPELKYRAFDSAKRAMAKNQPFRTPREPSPDPSYANLSLFHGPQQSTRYLAKLVTSQQSTFAYTNVD